MKLLFDRLGSQAFNEEILKEVTEELEYDQVLDVRAMVSQEACAQCKGTGKKINESGKINNCRQCKGSGKPSDEVLEACQMYLPEVIQD